MTLEVMPAAPSMVRLAPLTPSSGPAPLSKSFAFGAEKSTWPMLSEVASVGGPEAAP